MDCVVYEAGGKRVYALRYAAMPPMRKSSWKRRNWETIMKVLGDIAKRYEAPVLGVTRLYCSYKGLPWVEGRAVETVVAGRRALLAPWRFSDTYLVENGDRYCRYVVVTIMYRPYKGARRLLEDCFRKYVEDLELHAVDGDGDLFSSS